MLNDDKIVKKIKEFDSEYQNQNNYVYAVFTGGLNKKYFWSIFIAALIMMVIVVFYNIDPVIASAIIGGMTGGILSLSNEYSVIIPNDTGIDIYKFNVFQTKIINKKQIDYQNIELIKYKKTSIWNNIELKISNEKKKLMISDKTIGLKNQIENATKLIEKMTNK